MFLDALGGTSFFRSFCGRFVKKYFLGGLSFIFLFLFLSSVPFSCRPSSILQDLTLSERFHFLFSFRPSRFPPSSRSRFSEGRRGTFSFFVPNPPSPFSRLGTACISLGGGGGVGGVFLVGQPFFLREVPLFFCLFFDGIFFVAVLQDGPPSFTPPRQRF